MTGTGRDGTARQATCREPQSNRRGRSWVTVLLVLCMFVAGFRATAGEIPAYLRGTPEGDFLELAKDAEGVALVEMAWKRCYWSEDRNLIYTEYLLHSESTVYGDAPSSFTHVEEGGEVDGIGLEVSDALHFVGGTKYLVLLRRDGSTGGYSVVGGETGALLLEETTSSLESLKGYIFERVQVETEKEESR